MLSDSQVDKVYDLVVSRGVNLEQLRHELIDHLCCQLEHTMQTGESFENALVEAEHQFGPSGLAKTQEATIYVLTLKLKLMKKSASILAIIGGFITIAATVFKLSHWPGASILLFLGLGVLAVLYMPMALMVSLKAKNSSQDKLATTSGFIAGMILILSALFKIMHWPGANVFFTIGTGIMILVFIPLTVIKAYKRAENRWFDIGNLVAIFSGMVLLFSLFRLDGDASRYFRAVKSLEAQSIGQYKDLTNEIAEKANALTAKDESKVEPVVHLQVITEMVVASFYDYRNSLLAKSEVSSSRRFEEVTKGMGDFGFDQYPTWPAFMKQLETFRGTTGHERLLVMKDLLEEYKTLSKAIMNTSGSSTGLDKLMIILENAPNPENLASDMELLYLNYLNLTEFELRSFQASLFG